MFRYRQRWRVNPNYRYPKEGLLQILGYTAISTV